MPLLPDPLVSALRSIQDVVGRTPAEDEVVEEKVSHLGYKGEYCSKIHPVLMDLV